MPKVTDLPPADLLTGSEVIPLVQDGEAVGAPMRYVTDLAQAAAQIQAEDAAASAAQAKALTGPTYANIAAGLAATTDGDFFAVKNGDIVTIYLNDGGTAVAQRDIVTAQALASTAAGKGAALIGSDDGASGSLWSTIASFITFLRSGLGATIVGFRAAGIGTAVRTLWAKLNDLPLSIDDFGAVASTDQSTASANVTAIRAALLAGVSTGLPVFVPKRTNPYLVNDNFELNATYSGLRIIGEGTLKFANALVTGNVEAPWMFNIKDRTNPISNLRIEGVTLDGNRANVKQSGVTPATSFGIWVDPRTLLGDGVEINSVTAINFLTTGIQIQQGPIVVRFPTSRGHRFHGIGLQNDPLGMAFQGWASVIGARTSDCEGYGLDASGGKAIVVDHVDEGSWYGNAKASVGLEHLIIRGAHWRNSPGNPANPASGRGFLTTGTAADFLNSVIDMDDIYVEGAASLSFQVGAFAGRVRLGSIITRNGNPSLVNAELGDISLACDGFDARYLESRNSGANGIVITAGCKRYNIEKLVSFRASRAGFTCRATTSLCHGIIGSVTMIENNQSNLTGAAAAALQHISAGSCKVNGGIIDDTQGTPTQVTGMYFANAVLAEVNNVHFGSGITAGQQVMSATAGTRVRFGRNNTGIVTFARGTRTGNGGSTAQNLAFPTAFTGLGGAVFYAQVVPASADAAGDHFVSSVSPTVLGVTYPVAPGAGANNVSYRYDVEMEVQR